MQHGIQLVMDPKEWRSLIALARKAKPSKDSDEKAMSKMLEKNGDMIAKANTVTIQEPF